MITTRNDKESYPIPMASAPTRAPELVPIPRLPKELVKSTVFLLKRLGDAVRERAMPEFVAAGCNPYHHAVLALLGEGARDTQGEIADALGFDRSQLVGILDELEEGGLIERKRDPADRRRHLVRLTPDGEKMLRRLRTLSAEIEDGFLSPLSDKERATLHGLLFRLAEEHDPRCGPIGAPGLTV